MVDQMHEHGRQGSGPNGEQPTFMFGRKPESVNIVVPQPPAGAEGRSGRGGRAAAARACGGEGGGGGAARGNALPGAGGQQRCLRRVRPTSRGTRRATSGLPRRPGQQPARREVSTKTGKFALSIGSAGQRSGPVQRRPLRWPSMPKVTSTSPIPATTGSRCSTTTARSRARSRTSATPRPSASRRARTRCCTSRTRIRRTTSTPPARSTR